MDETTIEEIVESFEDANDAIRRIYIGRHCDVTMQLTAGLMEQICGGNYREANVALKNELTHMISLYCADVEKFEAYISKNDTLNPLLRKEREDFIEATNNLYEASKTFNDKEIIDAIVEVATTWDTIMGVKDNKASIMYHIRDNYGSYVA